MIDVQAMTGSEDFEELVFDGPDAFAPAAPEPAPTPTTTGRKRIARTAAKPSAETAAEAPPAPAPAPPETLENAAVPEAAPRPAATLPAWIALVALAIGLFAATLSAVGLLVAARTIAHADLAARDAEQERALLARVPASLARLDEVIAREQAALARLADGRAGQPATIADVRRELDGLRLALGQHQQPQDLKTIEVVRAGQSEIVDRMSAMSAVLDRLDHAGRPGK